MDEATAFGRRLRRSAVARAAEVDGELGTLFRRVAERRARRVSKVTPTLPRPADAPVDDDEPGRVLAVESVGPNVRILRVGKPPGFRFRAGQHVKLGVPGGRTASFSITSAPHDPHLEFCIELVPGGRVTPALFALVPGDRVEVGARPKGSFTLDERATRHLMVATVTGIAPLRSMLRDALHRGLPIEFVVLHGARHAEDVPYLDELLALGAGDAPVVYRPTLSGAGAGAVGPFEQGRVDGLARKVAADQPTDGTRVYACGHPDMVEQVAREMSGAGFAVATETFD